MCLTLASRRGPNRDMTGRCAGSRPANHAEPRHQSYRGEILSFNRGLGALLLAAALMSDGRSSGTRSRPPNQIVRHGAGLSPGKAAVQPRQPLRGFSPSSTTTVPLSSPASLMSDLPKVAVAPKSEDEYDVDEKKRSAASSPLEDGPHSFHEELEQPRGVAIPWIKRGPLILAVLFFTLGSNFAGAALAPMKASFPDLIIP